jgi:hypothetical protein
MLTNPIGRDGQWSLRTTERLPSIPVDVSGMVCRDQLLSLSAKVNVRRRHPPGIDRGAVRRWRLLHGCPDPLVFRRQSAMVLRRPSRIVAAIIAAAVAYLATSRLPDELNLLIPYDVAVAIYIALFGVFMQWACPTTHSR